MFKNRYCSSREVPPGRDEHIRRRLCGCRRSLVEINQAALFSYSCIFFVCISYCLQLLGHTALSRWVLLSVFVIYGYSSVCAILQSFRGVNTVTASTAWQMFWISFLFSLLWDLSLKSPLTLKGHDTVLLFGTVSLNLSTVIWLLTIAVQENIFRRFFDFVKSNVLIVFLIGIYFALSFSVVYNWPKIDSYDYYSYIKNAVTWDFTFKTFDAWKLCSHNSFGYALFAVIGEYLWAGDGKGVRLMQIVLVCISIGAFSGIIKKLGLDHHSKFENFLFSALFAFTPLILGTVFEMTLDLPMACFFIWFLYSYINEKKVFLLASIFLLIFTKETAIIILFGFGVGWIFVTVFSYGRKNGFLAVFRQKSFWYQIAILVLPALFFVSVFLLGDQWTGRIGSTSTGFSLQGDQLFSFGINPDNIAIKFKEFAAMNFSWLMLVVICVGFLYLIFRRRSRDSTSSAVDGHVCFWVSVLLAVICFIVLNFIYIDLSAPRYVTSYFAVLPLLLAGAIYAMPKKFRVLICGVMASLLLVQNFVTIDPVMLSAFKNIDIGKGTIITARTFIFTSDGVLTTDNETASFNELANSATYNREYSYLSDLLEVALNKIDYDEDTLLVLAPTYAKNLTRMSFLGGHNDEIELYYDQRAQQLTFDTSKEKLNYYIPGAPTDIPQMDNYRKAYILYFPYREKYYHVDSLLKQYEILDSFSVDYHRWVVNIYQVK